MSFDTIALQAAMLGAAVAGGWEVLSLARGALTVALAVPLLRAGATL